MRFSALFAIFAAGLLGGCSLITTTTDTTAQIAEGITNATAASSDASTGSDAVEARIQRATRFVKSQRPYLQRDAAAGGGENLDALARLLGESNPDEFSLWMQRNYAAVFRVERNPEELVRYIATQRG